MIGILCNKRDNLIAKFLDKKIDLIEKYGNKNKSNSLKSDDAKIVSRYFYRDNRLKGVSVV